LIVDDDRYILTTFSKTLTKRGFEVETSETGLQALDKLRQSHFDVALIDVCLPDMQGPELLVTAKKELEKTVKIMVTGHPSIETSDKASYEGADTYVVKPIKIDELVSLIKFFLKTKTDSA
jgi:two-component system NtrC family response regulator